MNHTHLTIAAAINETDAAIRMCKSGDDGPIRRLLALLAFECGKLAGESMKDTTGAEIVEVRVRNDGKVLWVNVDGACEFRVCRIEKLEVIDERQSREETTQVRS